MLRRAAWQAALAGLIVGLIVAVSAGRCRSASPLNSVLNGAVFALWPVMWIVVNALLLYNIAVRSGRFDAFRTWVITHLPNDRRVVLVVVGFCFGALLEGIAGFGTPVAITSSLLILVGFPPLEALVFVLIFNTAPVAFGALGVPVTVLGAVTGLPASVLGAMIGRQLPIMALILPFYVTALYGGRRSVRALWPVLLVAGGSFAIMQFVSSNFIDYTLTDVLSSLGSLIATLLFLKVWRPVTDPEFKIEDTSASLASERSASDVPAWQGWLPWVIVSVTVILWTSFKVAAIGQQNIPWPGLHQMISITLYNDKPYAAIWAFQPLGTGTAILVAAVITALFVRLSPAAFLSCVGTDHPPGLAGGYYSDADRRPCLPDELLRPCLYTGPRGCFDRASFHPVLALPRLDGGACCRAATRRATRCSVICRSSPRGSSVSIPCCSPRPTPPAASWAR